MKKLLPIFALLALSIPAFARDFSPRADGVDSLGTSTLRWKNLFLSGTVGGSGVVLTSSTFTNPVESGGAYTSGTFVTPLITTGLTAAGSASNDFSASTGTFKTSSGANTLSGAVSIADATTPSLTTATGKTNTGFVTILGKTSGGLKFLPTDATGQTVTVTTIAQTSGATTLSIPNFAGVSDTFAYVTLAQTLSNKTFVAPVLGAATGTSLAVTAGITSSGPTGAGIGYATGAGGQVTQQTNRTTGVTLSKLTGQITTNTASLAAAAFADFIVTNTTVAATDVVVLGLIPGGTGSPRATVVNIAAGSFTIRVTNDHAATADTSADAINFVVLKGVSS